MKAIIRILFFVFAGSFLLSSCYKTQIHGPSATLTPFDTTYSATGGYVKNCLGTSLKISGGTYSLHEATTLPNANDISYTVNSYANNFKLVDTTNGYTYVANGRAQLQITYYNGQHGNTDSAHVWFGNTIKLVPTNGGNGGNPLFLAVKLHTVSSTSPNPSNIKVDAVIGYDPSLSSCTISIKP